VKRIIISGGGTGGHIFPAISIANALRQAAPEVEILFVGAEGKMEMEKVPAAGYRIVGLPVVGIQRKIFSPKNLRVPAMLVRSLRRAATIIRDFKPDVVVGVGGYASAPILWTAQRHHIPTLIQEQNSYAGLTNKLLARRADKVCVAYEGMERFFPKAKIIFSGNPVRQDLVGLQGNAQLKQEAKKFFGLAPDKRTILIIGGSLGARTINRSVMQSFDSIASAQGVQLLWQTGKLYEGSVAKAVSQRSTPFDNLMFMPFIARMDYAYAAADLVISRAGASSIAELCVVCKPAILVPSPNVAEDHQTANAMALVRKDAALMVSDAKATEALLPLALETVERDDCLSRLSQNIGQLAVADAAYRIVNEILQLIKK
jgi:UDP-N-acetylglucosamine--N-acetylmuramyl-(pentapeptide) pyrophosphoryl-undecaprenol N-acetylglucosamine transferase